MARRKSTWALGASVLTLLTVPIWLRLNAHVQAQNPNYEVWALDQADTHSDGGGLLYIWDSEDLSRNAKQSSPEIIDLAEAAQAAAADNSSCKIAKRPHMILANHASPPSHMVLANVASGDTFFLDIDSREIVGCVSTKEAAGGAVSSHNSSASPDNTTVLVDTIGDNGKSGFIHKINTDYNSNTFTLAETLDLAAATLADGTPVTQAVGTDLLRPICHEYTGDGAFAYVTLAGGGLLVVDVADLSVAHAYPAATVPGIGCGAFRLEDGRMLTNGESGQGGGDDFLYVFQTQGAAQGDFPNPVQIELPGEDTHGISLCRNAKNELFAAVLMRVSNDLNVVDLQTNTVIKTISLERPFSPNPAPDVTDTVGNTIFVTLRGAKPLTAITQLEDAERTPGVGTIRMNQNCNSISWSASSIALMTANPNTVEVDGQTVTASDPHGLDVVRRN